MYTPYAYNGQPPTNGNDYKKMMEVLGTLNPKYCNCAAGAAGHEVGYLCPGTCLDWIYDHLKTKYSYGIEIWDGDAGFKNKYMTTNLLELSSRMKHKRSCFTVPSGGYSGPDPHPEESRTLKPKSHSPFPQPSNRRRRNCVTSFNPSTPADYEATVENWSRAFLDLFDLSIEKMSPKL